MSFLTIVGRPRLGACSLACSVVELMAMLLLLLISLSWLFRVLVSLLVLGLRVRSRCTATFRGQRFFGTHFVSSQMILGLIPLAVVSEAVSVPIGGGCGGCLLLYSPTSRTQVYDLALARLHYQVDPRYRILAINLC